MSTNRKSSNLMVLEKYRVALTNVASQPDIAGLMAECGYTAEKLKNGKDLLAACREAYYSSTTERDKMQTASKIYQRKWKLFKQTFTVHRNIAKVACRKDEIAAGLLSVDGPAPKSYLKWIDAARKLYTKALASEEYLQRLAVLKLPEEEINESLKQIDGLEASRSEYLKEKGISENATDAKKKAFQKIDDWMGDFYAVAKIAFMDQPQLQEALGRVVKN